MITDNKSTLMSFECRSARRQTGPTMVQHQDRQMAALTAGMTTCQRMSETCAHYLVV
jgi:hypothetical protein